MPSLTHPRLRGHEWNRREPARVHNTYQAFALTTSLTCMVLLPRSRFQVMYILPSMSTACGCTGVSERGGAILGHSTHPVRVANPVQQQRFWARRYGSRRRHTINLAATQNSHPVTPSRASIWCTCCVARTLPATTSTVIRSTPSGGGLNDNVIV